MLGLTDALLGVVITVALATVAARLRALTVWAAVVAAAFGSLIVVLGGFAYLGLLALFLLASGLATRYRFEEKARHAVQEGKAGERGVTNVLSHIWLPAVLILFATLLPTDMPPQATSFLYASAIAFGAADTFASELGILAGSAVAILTLRPVPPGTNGGISGPGLVYAFAGAITTALFGAGLFWAFSTPLVALPLFIGGVTLAGFAGCQIDSVLGETLENRGYLTKGSTNFVSMAATILIGLLLLYAAGVPVG